MSSHLRAVAHLFAGKCPQRTKVWSTLFGEREREAHAKHRELLSSGLMFIDPKDQETASVSKLVSVLRRKKKEEEKEKGNEEEERRHEKEGRHGPVRATNENPGYRTPPEEEGSEDTPSSMGQPQCHGSVRNRKRIQITVLPSPSPANNRVPYKVKRRCYDLVCFWREEEARRRTTETSCNS